MSFRSLLEKLLASLIELAGPMIIEVIIKWLQSLSGDEVKEVAKNITDGFKEANKENT